jgi:parallel beta-helix repeat protein
MTASKIYLIILTFGIIVQTTHARVIVVNPGNDLNAIINKTNGGDTVIVKPGTYKNVSLSNKKYSAEKPLVVRAFDSKTVYISGNTISKGCSLEIIGCSYIVIDGLTFINSMWGIYVKSSDHIIIKNNEIYNTGQEGVHIGRSSQYIDASGNEIHNTGQFNSKWAEGIYVGSGSYSGTNFPDNCEYIWIEDNHIYETGNAEGINIKGESFHITVINNKIHDIHPGTNEQYNQAGITVEGGANSIEHDYRLSEKRDIWVENNTIWNVSDGYSDWNNGIMFFGTGVYIVNNTIYNCANKGIYGNNWKNLGLQNYVYGNNISQCSTSMYLHPELKISGSDPGKNPHSPQKW